MLHRHKRTNRIHTGRRGVGGPEEPWHQSGRGWFDRRELIFIPSLSLCCLGYFNPDEVTYFINLQSFICNTPPPHLIPPRDNRKRGWNWDPRLFGNHVIDLCVILQRGRDLRRALRQMCVMAKRPAPKKWIQWPHTTQACTTCPRSVRKSKTSGCYNLIPESRRRPEMTVFTVRETGLGWNNNTALMGYLEFSASITTLTCRFYYLTKCVLHNNLICIQ